MSYPSVRDEFETIKVVLKGKSLARLGDGEFPHAYGKDGRRDFMGSGRQCYHPDLSVEMAYLLCDPHPNCIVGIPTMDPKGPKYENWIRHRARFAAKLSPKVKYYSSFVTRPDSAPWIDNRQFCETFARAWEGKRVAVLSKVVREDTELYKDKDSKVLTLARLTAREVVPIECPATDAYQHIDQYEREIVAARPDVALLSAGPTATVLANRLAAKGVQAIDLGSAGAFLLRHLAPSTV